MSNKRGDNFIMGNRPFYGHDTRTESYRFPYNKRGGRWKHNSQQGRGANRGNYRNSNYRNNDGDNNKDAKRDRRRNMYTHGRGGQGRGGANNRSLSPLNSLGWRRITVKNYGNSTQEQVMNTLKSHVESDFNPIKCIFSDRIFQFYLDRDPSAEESLLALSHRISVGSQTAKLQITSDKSVPAKTVLTDEKLQFVERVLGKRYSSEMNSLNLSNFHRDPEFLQANIYCPLERNDLPHPIFQLIVKNVPNVNEIDMTNNKLTFLNGFEELKKLPNLQKLNLFMNKIPSFHTLKKLSGINLTELNIGSPMFNRKYKNRLVYEREARRIFPDLKKLDDKEMTEVIGFDVNAASKLPEVRPSFCCSEEAKTVVMQFIEQYYQVFEGQDRNILLAAYTEDAKFSIIIERQLRHPSLNPLYGFNRNLMADDPCRTLSTGRENILSLLNLYPKAAHDPLSFVVDIPLALPELIHITINGVLRLQPTEKNPRLVAFMRSLVIVPVGSGFCISNEELSLSTPTPDQKNRTFTEIPKPANVIPTPVMSLEKKQEMVIEFARNSKMLPQFCQECLENNGWDFEKAAKQFVSLKEENKIPPEYYDQSMI